MRLDICRIQWNLRREFNGQTQLCGVGDYVWGGGLSSYLLNLLVAQDTDDCHK